MRGFLITEVELKRYSILRDVVEGRLTLKDAGDLIGVSYRHVHGEIIRASWDIVKL